MLRTDVLKNDLQKQIHADLLTDIYVDSTRIPYQTKRYIDAITAYENHFGIDEVEIYSAPGRSEIGGNHTDHQHGEVLAASINNDAIAIVKALDEPIVKVISDGYDLITRRRRNYYFPDQRCSHRTCRTRSQDWRLSGIHYK